MERIREVLPAKLWNTMVRKLGREESLRLLWTSVVGPNLAAQTSLRRLRGRTLVVSVPDLHWTRSLRPLEQLILDSVSRFPDSWRADSIDFVVETRPVAAIPGSQPDPIAPALNAPRRDVRAAKFAGARPWDAYVAPEQQHVVLPEESSK
jgi:Dna[CI] antecedent, DciA